MSSNQRTKILYVITKSNFGGAQRYVFDLATHLPKEEFDVVVALGGTGEQGAQAGTLNKMLQEVGVRTVVLKHASRNIHVISDVFLFFELLHLFKKECPDVIHLNSSKVGGLGTLAARLFSLFSLLSTKNYQLKTIFTVHGFAFAEERHHSEYQRQTSIRNHPEQ